VRSKALGSMLAALLMGYIGTYVAPSAVFYVAAVFGGMARGCLLIISGVDIGNAPHRTDHPTAWPRHARTEPLRPRCELSRDPMLLTFAISVIQYQGVKNSDVLVSIALIVSLAVVAIVSPRMLPANLARGLHGTRGALRVLVNV
jgi:hypothetical protein